MTSLALPDLRQFVLDAIEILYGDAKDARELMGSDLGINSDTVRLWTRGRRSPSADHIAAIRAMLIEKMGKAEAFRHRLDHAMPLLACPICGGGILVHHHATGRTVQCRKQPGDHVFEPAAGIPIGEDGEERFALVPGGLSEIERRDFNADCVELVVGETVRFPGQLPPVAKFFRIAVGDAADQPAQKAWLVERSEQRLSMGVGDSIWVLAADPPGQIRSWTIAAKLPPAAETRRR